MHATRTHTGQSLAEYGLTIGLAVLLAIAGLTALGQNLFSLFDKSSAIIAQSSSITTPASDMPKSGGSGQPPIRISIQSIKDAGLGYYKSITDSVTGESMLVVADENSGSDGDLNGSILGTQEIAEIMAQLVETETDPVLKRYYLSLVEKTFYPGAGNTTGQIVSGGMNH